MTRIVQKRCVHCSVVYSFQVSGAREQWSDDSRPMKVLGAVEVDLVNNTTRPWRALE